MHTKTNTDTNRNTNTDKDTGTGTDRGTDTDTDTGTGTGTGTDTDTDTRTQLCNIPKKLPFLGGLESGHPSAPRLSPKVLTLLQDAFDFDVRMHAVK